MKVIATVTGLGKWSGPIREDGGRIVLPAGVHEIETDDPVDIRGLVHVHMAYRTAGYGVVIESDDPVWVEKLQESWDREAEDYAVAESWEGRREEPREETE